MKNEKKIFQELCNVNQAIPIFLTYDWMQVVAGENWDVALSFQGDEVNAFHVHAIYKKSSQSIIANPLLTPYSGVWIKYPEEQKLTTRLSYEKKVITSLIQSLPSSFDGYYLSFHPGFTYCLPFLWQDFSQTTRYTYIISRDTSIEKAYNDFNENVRREIRKAKEELEVRVLESVSELYALKQSSYAEKNERLPVSLPYLENLFALCKSKNCGKVLGGFNKQGKLVSSILLVEDSNSFYYLFGASDPEDKNSGAMSLLLWQGIQEALGKQKDFNFEGSMKEPIERFFRNFGGKPVAYHHIYKTNSWLLKLKQFIKGSK